MTFNFIASVAIHCPEHLGHTIKETAVYQEDFTEPCQISGRYLLFSDSPEVMETIAPDPEITLLEGAAEAGLIEGNGLPELKSVKTDHFPQIAVVPVTFQVF